MNRQQYEGLVTFFNPDKNFGFITSREASGKIRQFFFHAARLVNCEVEIKDIEIGMFARFYESSAAPKPGNYPYAVEIELYEERPALVAGLEALSGPTKAAQ